VTKLVETVYQEAIDRVDPQSGILYGVKVLGESSRNKRRYAKDAMREAVSKYDGVKSYVDHPDRERLSEDRKFSAWSGVFKNPRYVEGKGIYADLHLRQKGDYFEGIIEAAQKFPTAVGFSHVAEGESHLDGETEIVESIREVFSVDLVTDPATTKGMYESVHKTFKALVIESLPESPERQQLIEMAGEYGIGEMSMGDVSGDKPVDLPKEVVSMAKLLIQMLGDALKAKSTPPPVAPAPNANPDAPAEESNPAEEDMSDEDKEKLAAFESLSRENAELKASKLLLESGRQATPARMKALANCENEDEQRELLESWPKLEENGRPARSPAAIESTFDFPRDNPEKFAALLR
jgi:hypothetical protein